VPPPANPANPADAAAVQPATELTPACIDAAVRFTEIKIAEAKAAADKSAIQQDQAMIVRRMAEACTKQQWSSEVIACYKAASSGADLIACGTKVAPGSQPKGGERPTPEPNRVEATPKSPDRKPEGKANGPASKTAKAPKAPKPPKAQNPPKAPEQPPSPPSPDSGEPKP
jgi:hypothetical protein